MARNAILIGCDGFREPEIFAPLRFPARDVERLAALLLDPRYGRFDTVDRLLNPAADEAKRMLERVFSRSRPDDLTLFYYSGHGKLRRDGCLALILADTESDVLGSTALGSDELKSRINELPAGQKVVILDCCYSGAFGPEGLRGGSADAPLSDLPALATGSHVLTASTRFQVARELDTIGGGILTDAIVRGVETGAAAPANRSIITLADLVQYVQSALAADGGQAPQYWASESSGPVIIANKTRAFDAEWVASARRALSVHELNDAIDQETADQARESLRTAVDPARRADLELIDDLVSKRVSAGQFVRTWVSRRLAREAETAPPRKARAPRAAPASEAPQKPRKVAERPAEAQASIPTAGRSSPPRPARDFLKGVLEWVGVAAAIALAVWWGLTPHGPKQVAPPVHSTVREFTLKPVAAPPSYPSN